jgi:hypothetical protein
MVRQAWAKLPTGSGWRHRPHSSSRQTRRIQQSRRNAGAAQDGWHIHAIALHALHDLQDLGNGNGVGRGLWHGLDEDAAAHGTKGRERKSMEGLCHGPALV